MLLGALFLVINPPFAVNDERSHLLRIYELSQGHLVSPQDETGSYHMVPAAYPDLILRYAKLPRDYKKRTSPRQIARDLTMPAADEHPGQIAFRGGAAFYTPVSYLPQIPVLALVRLLHLPSLWDLYACRAASVMWVSLVGAWAVSLAGPLAWAWVALGLMPMTLTECAGVSGDGMLFSLALLFTSLVLRGATATAPVPSRRLLAATAVTGVLIVMCKSTSIALLLALPALRWEGDRARLKRWGFTLAVPMVAFVAYMGWAKLNIDKRIIASGNSPIASLLWLGESPVRALKLAGGTLLHFGDDYLIQFVAYRDVLHNQVRFSGGAIALLYLVFLAALSRGSLRKIRSDGAVGRPVAIWFTTAGVAGCLAIFAAMYLATTAMEDSVIRGVQGRYFASVVPMLLVGVAIYGRPVLSRFLTMRPRRAVGIILVLNAVCLLTLIGRYYAPTRPEWPY